MRKIKRSSKPTYAFVLGTRPEIVKLSPLIRLFERLGRRFILIHTGQHYSYEMDKLFFKELCLPLPHHHLSLPSKVLGRQGEHTGRMMGALETVFMKESPDIVFVQGDTNSVLAASVVAAKLPTVRLAHVEAGLRSYDRLMPEEVNRILSDHVSDYLFAPTEGARKILRGEGIPDEKIFVTGNTIVDAVKQNLAIAKKRRATPRGPLSVRKPFFLLTLHRQENVDYFERFSAILQGLALVAREFKYPILFPMHPRTRRRLEEFNLRLPDGVRTLVPIGFLDFLRLEAETKLVLTDSGGVQEEACILGVPCVTFRTTTERPETLTIGSNVLAGYEPKKILRCAQKMFGRKATWKNPFGDGRAGERILNIVEKKARG